jgi:DNA primase
LDDTKEPKYLNSPETAIFRKGENLYGLFQAKNYLYQNIPILVEGNFDLLSLTDKSINNVVAPLGTSFTQDQALLLRRFSNQVIIAFDGDASGRAATLRTLEIFLKANIEPQIIMLPDGFDPDKYIRTYGKDGIETLIKNSYDFIDFLVKTKDTSSIANQQSCLKEIIRLISLLDSNMSQELYINKTAEIFKLSKESLQNQIIKESHSIRSVPGEIKKSTSVSLKLIEEQILPIILTFPEYALIAKQEFPAVCFSSPQIQEIIQILYDKIESENFSIAKLIDEIEKPELTQLIADLSFRNKSTPTKNEFQRKLRTIKAKWFYNEMNEAKNKGDKVLLEKLSLEHYNLKKKLSQKSNVAKDYTNGARSVK